MTSEGPSRCEFSELMPYHILCHIDWNECLSIVDSDSQPYEIRCNGRGSAPSLDDRLLTGTLCLLYTLIQLVVDERWFLQ